MHRLPLTVAATALFATTLLTTTAAAAGPPAGVTNRSDDGAGRAEVVPVRREAGDADLVTFVGDSDLPRRYLAVASGLRERHDENGDGSLDAAERAALLAALPAYHDSLRSAVDRDRNGRIGSEDWRQWLRTLHEGGDQEALEAALARAASLDAERRDVADADEDGRLDTLELVTFERLRDLDHLRTLAAADRDGDGRVAGLELERLRGSSERLELTGGRRAVVERRRTLGFAGGVRRGPDEPIRSVQAEGRD